MDPAAGGLAIGHRRQRAFALDVTDQFRARSDGSAEILCVDRFSECPVGPIHAAAAVAEPYRHRGLIENGRERIGLLFKLLVVLCQFRHFKAFTGQHAQSQRRHAAGSAPVRFQHVAGLGLNDRVEGRALTAQFGDRVFQSGVRAMVDPSPQN